MIPHTVAINEAKSKLLDELIGDTQTDPRPIIVTLELVSVRARQSQCCCLPACLKIPQ